MTDKTNAPKPPKRWLAFLLNLFLAPAGYVYAGRPLAAVVLVGVALVLGGGMWLWTLNDPPGVYAWSVLSGGGVKPWQISLPVMILLGLHAAWRPRPRSTVKGARAWGLALCLLALCLAANFVTGQLYKIYVVPSGSMAPTVSPGDIVLVRGGDMFCNPPSLTAGDVVTQRKNGVIYAKRLVAGPGQLVEIRDGRLIIDGQAARLDSLGRGTHGETLWRETLANGASYVIQDLGDTDSDQYPAKRVAEGTWFTLGDNRDNSLDSRHTGPVPTTNICGRGVKILYSQNKGAIGRPL